MNQEAYETFFYWINERHRIYLKKEAGEPKPWSSDPIFQEWKFCNVFRELDTQSKYLINNIIKPAENWNTAKILFNIFLFRAFNWYPTYEAIGGYQFEWDERTIAKLLRIHTEKNQLTSGAYMIRGREGMSKYRSIAMTLSTIWKYKEYIVERMQDEPIETLEEMQELLMAMKFWGWGPFTIYQIVLDLTYSKRFLPNAPDINTWCEFGPGARRGIRLIYPDIREKEMIEACKGLLAESPSWLDDHVRHKLTLQDIEFSLCELSKYMRIKSGGRSKNKYNGS